jgi:hypothetical protein
MMRSRIINISIQRDHRTVYGFVSNLENLPRWAGKAFKSIKQLDGEWIAETTQGTVRVSLVERNEFGVLDHYVKTSTGTELFIPMRVVKNGDGSEVIFTLFQTPEMSDVQFDEDAKLVEQDLFSLKNIMEGK